MELWKRKVLSLGATSQAIIWDRNWNKGVGMQWQNGISEAKILFLSVLIHQWHYSLVDCLIRCNQLPADEHIT